MILLNQTAPAIESLPVTQPIPLETIPADPDDSFGVDRTIIEEIEEIGRKHAEPQE